MTGAAYFFHTPHQDLQLFDGSRLDVIAFNRTIQWNWSFASGQHVKEQQLVVRYWSDKHGCEEMRNEARGLATMFYPLARSNRLDVVLLQPSRPALLRSFPIVTYSCGVRFSKDHTGFWREDRIP